MGVNKVFVLWQKGTLYFPENLAVSYEDGVLSGQDSLDSVLKNVGGKSLFEEEGEAFDQLIDMSEEDQALEDCRRLQEALGAKVVLVLVDVFEDGRVREYLTGRFWRGQWPLEVFEDEGGFAELEVYELEPPLEEQEIDAGDGDVVEANRRFSFAVKWIIFLVSMMLILGAGCALLVFGSEYRLCWFVIVPAFLAAVVFGLKISRELSNKPKVD